MTGTARERPRHAGPDRSQLRIERWAADRGRQLEQLLGVPLAALGTGLANSDATGRPLVSNGRIGADLIRLAAGSRFIPHTHAGDHILLVIGGEGTVTYDGVVYPTCPGEIYLIEGNVPHAVGAVTDHVLLAIGAPPRPLDAPDRMRPVDYREIVSSLDDLTCLICGLGASVPHRLHDIGCPHCPCEACARQSHEHDG